MVECDDYICEDTCDGCSVKRAGVMFHCNGTPVLFLCHVCNPRNFEKIGSQTVARVLACSRPEA